MITAGQILFAVPLAITFEQAIKVFAKKDLFTITQKTLSKLNFFFMTMCFGLLIYKFVTSDFSYAVVFQNSHTMKPLLYKITGVWGNHEGSMLLFLFILSSYNFIYAMSSKFQYKDDVLGFNGCVIFLIAAYTYFTSDPFDPVAADFIGVKEGLGLNPLLQDIGLAIHPPLLYTGYAGFSITFSIALTVFRNNIIDRKWVDFVRPWVLFAWSILSIGVGFGSWWAYRELGWGGFWFWDPVENISLLPWLFGCSLIHSLLCTKKFNKFTHLSLFLALATFLCGLLGFFLVRSGILSSVHSFASDPTRGIFMLAVISIIAFYSMIIFGKKLFEVKYITEGQTFFLSREIGILIMITFLLSAALAIMLGIFYPMITELFFKERISVGEPYFNMIVVPITLVLMVIMVFAPILKWQRESMRNLFKRSLPSLIMAAFAIALLRYFSKEHISPFLYFAIFSSAWLFISAVQIILLRALKREKISKGFTAMIIAHAAFGLLGLSITLNSIYTQDEQKVMLPGQNEEVAGYKLKFNDTQIIKGKNYLAQKGDFTLSDNKGEVANLSPESRIYLPLLTRTYEADIHYTLLSDFYLVLGKSETLPADKKGKNGQEAFPVRIYIRPFMFFIWFSILAMAFGGFLAMLPKKKA